METPEYYRSLIVDCTKSIDFLKMEIGHMTTILRAVESDLDEAQENLREVLKHGQSNSD